MRTKDEPFKFDRIVIMKSMQFKSDSCLKEKQF